MLFFEYRRIFFKYLWLNVLLMILAGVSGFHYASQKIPVYRTSTLLFVNTHQASPILPGVSEGFFSGSLQDAYAQFMQTRAFVQHVVDRMDVPISAGAVRGSLDAQFLSGSQFFRISATHTDPEVAQKLANTASQVIIARDIQRQQAQEEQMESRRMADNSPERAELAALIQSLETERTYYADKIDAAQKKLAEGIGEDGSPLSDKEKENLITSLPELRYAHIDVQTRLVDAQSLLADLDATQSPPPPLPIAVVVDEALQPTTPLPRNIGQSTLLAMVFGLMVGIGISFLMEYLDYTVKTPETLDRVYGLPTQGVIGSVDRKNGNATPLVTLFDSLSSVSEAFRTLRTNVHLAGVTQPVQTLLVTSAGPGEGKTFVASNLAVSLALNGSRVILVDTDLRKPAVHKVFSLSRESGFTNLVVNPEQDLDRFLQATSVANLRVLTSGPIPPNPVELLDTPQAKQLMQHLKEHADVVIYDTPPVATVTDASIVAQKVDAVIQVVWAGQTRINLVQRSKDILEHVGARILGPVLNKVKISDLGYYSYYYSYGYYNENGNVRRHRSGLKRLLPRRKHGQRRRLVEQKEGIEDTVVDVDEISSNGVGDAHDLK